jgi:hypothetical protein
MKTRILPLVGFAIALIAPPLEAQTTTTLATANATRVTGIVSLLAADRLILSVENVDATSRHVNEDLKGRSVTFAMDDTTHRPANLEVADHVDLWFEQIGSSHHALQIARVGDGEAVGPRQFSERGPVRSTFLLSDFGEPAGGGSSSLGESRVGRQVRRRSEAAGSLARRAGGRPRAPLAVADLTDTLALAEPEPNPGEAAYRSPGDQGELLGLLALVALSTLAMAGVTLHGRHGDESSDLGQHAWRF